LSQDLSAFKLKKPKLSPLAHSMKTGKFPTLDWGLVKHIKEGNVKIIPHGIDKFTPSGIILVNGKRHEFDAAILATGYTHGLEQFLDDHEKLLAFGLPDCHVKPKDYDPLYRIKVPRTNGKGQSIIANTIFFPGFDTNNSGGASYGCFAWRIGEQMAVELGILEQNKMTLDIQRPKPSNTIPYIVAGLGLVVAGAIAVYLNTGSTPPLPVGEMTPSDNNKDTAHLVDELTQPMK